MDKLDAAGQCRRDAQVKQHRRSCAQFVLTVILMLNFLVLIYVHENIEHVYKLEHALELSLTKSKFGPHSKVRCSQGELPDTGTQAPTLLKLHPTADIL